MLALMLCFLPRLALAQSDPEAEALREKAIFEDYLNLRFSEAEAKLNQAIKLCETACSPQTQAKLYRDLGVVYVAGLKQRDAGIGMFVEAVMLDPNIQLDPDLSSDELQGALDEARGLAGEAAAVEPPPPDGPVQPPPATTEVLPVEEYEGVFHTPAVEQLVNTPLPLYIEVHDADWVAKVAKVKLYYRGFGMVRFKEMEAPKIGEFGYGVELSCDIVGMSPGKLAYYFNIFDEDGDAAADVGTEASPHTVEIKEQIEASPMPIPGQGLPPPCPSPVVETAPPGIAQTEPAETGPMTIEDCPPDFPGCEPPEDDFGEPEEEEKEFARHWVSIGFQADFLLMQAAPDACAGTFTGDLNCFEGDQVWDPAAREAAGYDGFDRPPGDGVLDDAGTVGGGFAMATQRILIGYDFAITQNLLVGARGGFAFNGGPTLIQTLEDGTQISGNEFFAIHGEVRLAYWFGQNVLSDQFVRPFVQLGGGAAQIDAGLDTEVIDTTRGSCDTGECVVPVTAWRKTGQGFISAGGGAMLAFAPTIGLTLEARFMQMLPASGSAIGAQGGMVFGF